MPNKRISLYQCLNARVKPMEKNGVDEFRIFCSEGHKLGEHGDMNYRVLERGEPLEYEICQSCPGIDYDEPVGKRDRGWMGKPVFDAKGLGRLGGLNGGNARASSLSPERRSEIASKAALIRWNHRVLVG